MIIEQTTLPGVLLIEPEVFTDNRGFLSESYQRQRYSNEGLERDFVQDNHCRSLKDTLRGLHFQCERPQGKLIYVTAGEIYDVAVDIRKGSPTYARWYGTFLNENNHRQLYIPEGFAHGFCVLSEAADVQYKFTDYYDPDDEYGVIWNDPVIQIEWPVENPVLSNRDLKLALLEDISSKQIPNYKPSDTEQAQGRDCD